MVWLAEKDFYVYARLFFLMSQRKCNFNGCIIPGVLKVYIQRSESELSSTSKGPK